MTLLQLRKVEGGESIINRSSNSKIILINCQNISGKVRKFSKSRMTKQTAPLSSSCKINPKEVSLIPRQSEYFMNF